MTARPHCQAPDTCRARTQKHCITCTAQIPEVRERRAAAVRAANAKPEVRARKRAAAQRIAADPEITARKSAVMRASHQRADVKARHKRGCQRAAIARLQDPDARRRMQENGHAHGTANLLLANRPDVIARRGAAIRAAHLAWCPEEYWPLNQRLKRQKVRLPERKAIITRKIEEKAFAGHDHNLAADYLRRFSAVYRCAVDGRIDPVGTHWRYGTRVIERIDVVRLAIEKGWRP